MQIIKQFVICCKDRNMEKPVGLQYVALVAK